MKSPLPLTLVTAWLVLAGMIFAVPQGKAQEKEIVNSIGMRLVPIGPGEFRMGAGEKPPASREQWDERDADEAPAHHVVISKLIWMGATEVTNAQFERFDPE